MTAFLGTKLALRAFLSRKVQLKVDPKGVYIFLAANYSNLGDVAITLAQADFLRRWSGRGEPILVPITQTPQAIRMLRGRLGPDALITVVGGGNTGDLYPDIELHRRMVIKAFPKNRIVLFPQSIEFVNGRGRKKAEEAMKQAYARHADLHMFAREEVSLQAAKAIFQECANVRIGLAPDVVMSWNPPVEADRSRRSDVIVLALRSDKERVCNYASEWACQLRSLTGQLVHTDTQLSHEERDFDTLGESLMLKMEEFRSAQVVITDRLHGMILAAITSTPFVALESGSFKVRATYERWMHGRVPGAYLARTEGDLLQSTVERLMRPATELVTEREEHLEFGELRTAVGCGAC